MKKILRNILFLIITVSLFAPMAASSVSPIRSSPATASLPVPVEEVNKAMKEFRSLSRKEKKERIKEAKKQLKEYRKQKKSGEPSTNQVLLIVLAILLPPLAVYLHEGTVNNKFWISLVLTLLFWIPGVIYALVVILDKDN